jgi:hypothetical protein
LTGGQRERALCIWREFQEMGEGLDGVTEDELLAELKRRRSICLWCDEPATLLCDAWIGGGVRDGYFVLDAKHDTCDAPICTTHAKLNGYICFRSGEMDTMDSCPVHAIWDAHLDPKTIPVTEEAVAAVRRAVVAEARRARFRSV